ncbi:MAG: helix-turn-helix domain-containing protein [Candidatus Tectimicrobiota bacterium]
MATAALKAFGAFFKARRQALGYTLRRFCLEKGLDPGNISKMERGRMPPPQNREKLTQYARHLQIAEGSDEWYEFFDLASAAQGRFPEEVLNDEELVKRLPVLFRTIRGEKVSDEQLNELIELLRGS